ncbi:hypothetical protein BJF79_03795 [Actinomadura sp. CNU-125]|uniref:hypothetical protein n=1 Tax=Actinomadura sp. CNU-125 TaxID=1904961 RepID=UPI000967D7F5|nr:hypothetical protein [Actinomadura sp. CNU-125]OLT13032.1 hypothetical protein BJF79_03795 [Actinomadura sp. CNU-125]
MNPDDTLNAIDAALEGWSDYDDVVSPDAMRWAPENPEPAGRVQIAPVGTPPGAQHAWTDIGWTDTDQRLVGISPGMAIIGDNAFRAFREAIHSIAPMTQVLVVPLEGAARSIHASTAPLVYGGDYRHHRRGCPFCNPAGNPKPLKANASTTPDAARTGDAVAEERTETENLVRASLELHRRAMVAREAALASGLQGSAALGEVLNRVDSLAREYAAEIEKATGELRNVV